jgi:hypothetical protein
MFQLDRERLLKKPFSGSLKSEYNMAKPPRDKCVLLENAGAGKS